MSGMPMTRDESPMSAPPEAKASLTARWNALPVRWKWISAAVAGAIVFIAYTDLIWPVAERWNAESSRLEAILDRAEGNVAQLPPSLEAAVEALGPIQVPRTEGEGSLALAETITEAIGSQPVSNFSFDARAGSRLPPAALREIVSGSGQRVERVVGEVGFTATPEQAAAIIAELESSPEIESISRLRMVRSQTDRKVDVKMTVEAWILTGRGRGR